MIDGGSHVWAGEVFSREVEGVEVEGVEVSCGGRAEPGSGILLLALQCGGGLWDGVSRQYLLEQLVAVREHKLPGLDHRVWVPENHVLRPVGLEPTTDRLETDRDQQ